MAKRARMFAPAAWQWDPTSLTTGIAIQAWSASGSLQGNVGLDEAREMVRSGGYFVGSCIHICQVHDRIDVRNRAA